MTEKSRIDEQHVGDRDEAEAAASGRPRRSRARRSATTDRRAAAAAPGRRRSAATATTRPRRRRRAGRLERRPGSRCPSGAASGPAARVPTKLPAIAAPVHSGNRRLACRASKTEPATVQAIVTADGTRRVTSTSQRDESRRPARPSAAADEQDARRRTRSPTSRGVRGDPAERRAVRERATRPIAPSAMNRNGRTPAPKRPTTRVSTPTSPKPAAGLEGREQRRRRDATVRPSPGRIRSRQPRSHGRRPAPVMRCIDAAARPFAPVQRRDGRSTERPDGRH